MNLKSIELLGFKSFAQKIKLEFKTPISAIVGPNGSGKSNIAEAFRFVLGEQSIKSMRGKKGEDLIFNGSRITPRSNRASVKLVFDNLPASRQVEKRIFDLDYDEVILERIVHRDGTNQYFINKSIVRLRDIIELLSSVNIGPTGHHIISQGESDRILSVNSKERKSMVEDALGLKIYFYKKKESVKKLEKTEQNIKEVQSLRREIKPHLKFLKRQVDKIKNTEILRDKLRAMYKEYLKREKIYIDSGTSKIIEAKKEPEQELKNLNTELERAEEILSRINPQAGEKQENEELLKIKNSIDDLRIQEQGLIRDLGKLEGETLFLEKIKITETQRTSKKDIPLSSIEDLNSKIETLSKEAEVLNDLFLVKEIISKIRNIFSDFILKNKGVGQKDKNLSEKNSKKQQELVVKKEDIEEKINLIKDREVNLNEQYKKIQGELENEHIEQIEAEKTILQIKAKESEIKSSLNSIYTQEKILDTDRTRFEEEMSEAITLMGRDMYGYMEVEISNEDGDRDKQESRRREVERIKIKLEDSGTGPSGEIFKEYRETADRDEFLEKEIGDLEKSKESLNKLISDLEEKLNVEFKEGVKKINEEFSKFFSSMFGGGSASIEVVKMIKKKYIEETEIEEGFSPEETGVDEEGLEINVSLPHKKIKGLDMLSGGERALTSIALTFAISQINPPPFVVLDEMDAALDEYNSKKYGDIIEKLSEFSQLVLITHNRETMSRAGVLYGITMGSDGVSKILSIELDDAVKIVK